MKPTPRQLKETNEIYESLVNYLISEKYADDKDSADTIISGMSSEWFEQIKEII